MDKIRQKHIDEMERLKTAIRQSDSPYLIRDYTKKLRKMGRELSEYDRYKGR